ncbi:MAG: hypothetical protein MUC60_15210 [Oscillatoria sp. Prado101]|nr:hypothetical protein [Oscillatoria sp. Prado101]
MGASKPLPVAIEAAAGGNRSRCRWQSKPLPVAIEAATGGNRSRYPIARCPHASARN